MHRLPKQWILAVTIVLAALCLFFCPDVKGQGGPIFKDYASFVQWMRSHQKAPFAIDQSRLMSKQQRALFERNLIARAEANKDKAPKPGKNVKVNQDRNPWTKVRISQAVDPSEPANVVVLSNDMREPSSRVFYHVSTDRGKQWTDDSVPTGTDDFAGGASFNFSFDAVNSYDAAGNEFIVQVGGNGLTDFQYDYGNSDSDLELLLGESHGVYHGVSAFNMELQSCAGPIGFGLPAACQGFVTAPAITTDTNPSSPTMGTSYVSYTFFCNFPITTTCAVGELASTVPSQNSAILAVQFDNVLENGWQGTGIVSGTLTNAQFSSVVVDASGTPHVFFDDFSNPSEIDMWESTWTGGTWVVSGQPVSRFVLSGTSNPNWTFGIGEAAAPGCSIFQNTAYCAFSANQIVGGPAETTESVYLAKVDVTTGASTITRVNNDVFGDGKDHLFAWATTAPSGAVYVGWYDDRNDPANVNADYFVAKSTDGGKTFPLQVPVNDVPFNPCVASCAVFTDAITQLTSGPDGVVHAAWSDGRDGVSLQIWSQAIKW